MRGINEIGRFAARWITRFLRSERGNTAMIFGLASIALVTAAGAAIDWSRAMVTKTRLIEALDAAGLAVGATSGLSQAQMEALAQQYFDANYPPDAIGTPSPVSVVSNGQTINLGVSATVPTTLLGVANIDYLSLSVSNQIVRSVTKLRVALVLDTTGSMSQTDSTGTTKISALKTATHQLLNQLQNAAINPGDVQVAIIPFSRNVNVGPSNVNANWVRWTEWDQANGSYNLTGYNTVCTGWSCSCSGYSNCSCTGSGSSKVCKQAIYEWVPSDHSTWDGCVMDRDKDPGSINYDTKNTTPDPSNNATKFPAQQYGGCPTALIGLNYNWSSLHDKVDQLSPSGNTNQTIGLAWGWQALSQNAPLNASAIDDTTQNVIILLSDGMNTQNRWTTSQSSIDSRMAMACNNVKAAKVVVYTVLVMAGNSSVLSNCASDADKYFELTTAGQIITAFNTIGTELSNLRLSL